MNTRTAATGKRVYRMGSFAPTRGKVNPVGYVKREMKKQALAKAVLARRKQRGK